MGTLATRFIEFCRTLPDAEEIDALPIEQSPALKRADFLLDHRSVICEIKTLETDTTPKFIGFLKQQGFDLPPGQYDVRQLFRTKPNGDQLFARATQLVATALSDGLAEANRQIRDTKSLFGISAADGVVVILNGMVEVLGPQLVIERVLQRLQKSAADGTPYHAHIGLVLYFSEKHLRETRSGDAAVTFPIRNRRVVPIRDLDALAKRFVKGWAEFNGRWYDEQAWDLNAG
ncbi:MAG: hypothetical protein HY735_37890 [Verrucomicrobia bacterium]|nr:hypothetical protein [Verrucomicrobiota bacterium]